MILFHRIFRCSENWLLSNLKQLPYRFKCLHQETEIPATGPLVRVGFPMLQLLDHQVSQTRMCGFAEVPSRYDLRPGLNLLAKTSTRVSEVQQNNVLTDQSGAKLLSSQRLPDSLFSWTKYSSGPTQM